MALKQWLKQKIKRIIRPKNAPPPSTPKREHTLAQVVDHYDKYTTAYEEVCGDIFQAGRPKETEVLLNHEMQSAQIEDGQRLLDAGCGVAGPARWFAKHKRVTIEGITISPPQVSLAAEKNEKAGLADRINVRLGDYHKIGDLFPADTFDCVYFLESISHGVDYSAILEGAWKVLKPGGHIYIKDIVTKDFSQDPSNQKRAEEFLHRLTTEYSLGLVTSTELTNLLERIGFKMELNQLVPFAGGEDFSYQVQFEQKVGFHWREGVDLWVVEQKEFRARKPA